MYRQDIPVGAFVSVDVGDQDTESGSVTWQGILVRHNADGSALIVAFGQRCVFAQMSDEILAISDSSFPENSRILPRVKNLRRILGAPEDMP